MAQHQSELAGLELRGAQRNPAVDRGTGIGGANAAADPQDHNFEQRAVSRAKLPVAVRKLDAIPGLSQLIRQAGPTSVPGRNARRI